MKDDGLSEVEIEQLLVGSGPSADLGLSDLAEALAAIRAEYVAPDLPPVGAALREFVDLDLIAGQGSLPAASAPDPVVQVTKLPRRGGFGARRRRAATTVSTFFGTLAGKIALGASVAMAATGGAHIAGVVDVPGLPDIAEHRISEEPDLPEDVVIDLDGFRVDTTTAGITDEHVHEDDSSTRPGGDEPAVAPPDDDQDDDEQGEDPSAEDPSAEDPSAEDPEDEQGEDPEAGDPGAEKPDGDTDDDADDQDDEESDEGDDDPGDDAQSGGSASVNAGGGNATVSAGGGTSGSTGTGTVTASGSAGVSAGSGSAGVTAGGSAGVSTGSGTVSAGGGTSISVGGSSPSLSP